MKKYVLAIAMSIMTFNGVLFAQSSKTTIDVLYFKANLTCCKARACNMLQSDLDSVLIKYYPKNNIGFKVVMLADVANKDLVAKYNAKSQTVVFVKTKGKKETSKNVSSIVETYAGNQNKDLFEKDIKESLNQILK